MILALAILLTTAVIVYTLFIRQKDLPEPEPVSPVAHLDERKGRIYENLRDLQFEYRVGKLSDEDYQRTKVGLQQELAAVMAEIDKVLGKAVERSPQPPPQPQPQPQPPPKPTAAAPAEGAIDLEEDLRGVWVIPAECPKCGAKFEKPMKFCGECGAPMQEASA